MRLSDIIGKQVFDIYDAKILGTVHEANFDEKYKRILGFYFFDQDENEYYIKKQNIYSVSDYLTIKNANFISNNFVISNPLSPLGKNVVSVSGKDFGSLVDIELDEKLQILKLLTQTKEILPSQVLNILSTIVVSNDDVKLKNFRPRTKKQNKILENLTVTTMKMDDQVPKQKLMPTKITVNSDILVGKKLSKDIFGKNNELILKQNQTITPKLVLIAKQHDRLNELFYSVY